MRQIRRWGFHVVVVLSLCASTGCQSTQPLPYGDSSDTERVATDDANDGAMPAMGAVEATLRDAYAAWEGTPHRLGGTSTQGVDCSGFLYVLFPALFNTALPRTTAAQAHAGMPVRASNLQPGDLVFFRPARKVRHVGVYLSNGEFLHVPNSGVRVNRLNEPYWANAYWMARRVLGDTNRGTSEPEDRGAPAAPRTGW
ncbi:MAG: hydrolase Nlp/P60 [Bacteroidetes bacterium]|nr:hydrolase Nlp/P60 [Bacteroidota bacterium]